MQIRIIKDQMSILNSGGIEQSASIIKISIILILVFLLETNRWLGELFNSVGLPSLRYQKLWFFFLPGFIIMMNSIRKTRFRMNSLFIFTIFFFVHYVMESFGY
jgi:hypothetical protein